MTWVQQKHPLDPMQTTIQGLPHRTRSTYQFYRRVDHWRPILLRHIREHFPEATSTESQGLLLYNFNNQLWHNIKILRAHAPSCRVLTQWYRAGLDDPRQSESELLERLALPLAQIASKRLEVIFALIYQAQHEFETRAKKIRSLHANPQ